MRETMLTEFASRESTVRSFLGEYHSWIAAKLECGIAEAVLFELNFPMVQVAARHLLSGVRLRSDVSRTIRELRKLLESVDLPQDSYPAFDVRLAREPSGPLARRKVALEAKWQGGPAALRLRGFPHSVVAASIPIARAGQEMEEIIELQTQVQQLLDMMQRLQSTVDSRFGLVQHLVEQSTDSVNQMNAAVSAVFSFWPAFKRPCGAERWPPSQRKSSRSKRSISRAVRRINQDRSSPS